MRMGRGKTEKPEIEKDSAEERDNAEESVEAPEQLMRNHIVDQRSEDCSGNDGRHLEDPPEDSESPENGRIFRCSEDSRNHPSDHRTVCKAGNREGRDRGRQRQIRNAAPPAAPAPVRMDADKRSQNQSEHTGQRDDHQGVQKIACSVGLEHQLDQLEDGTPFDGIGKVSKQEQTEQCHDTAERITQGADGPDLIFIRAFEERHGEWVFLSML